MRGRVCNLLLLLVLASAVPRDSRPHFIVPILETHPNLKGQFPVFISPRNRVVQIYPQSLDSLSVTFTTCRITLEVFCPTSTRELYLSDYLLSTEIAATL
jgi:hypothetical protein